MEIIMLVGIPGSGKSTVAEQYAQKGYKVHSSDAIREQLYGKEDIQGKAPEVFQILLQNMRKDFRAGFSCVVDASNLRRRRRGSMLSALSRCVEKRTCILVLADPDECLKRNSLRQRVVPPSRVYDMLCSFETPFFYEGWDEINVVVTGNPYVFPREKAMEFLQDNPYHSLTLGTHLDASRDYCAVHGFSEAVQEAAWYHDIGKMYTKHFANKNGEPTETAHYYGHENYGAYLYLCEKAAHSVKDGTWTDTLYIANLINWHMQSINKWQQIPGSEMKDRILMGEHMYQEIMQLHSADVEAHRKEIKKDE